jgi:hypothetical protein
VMDAVDTLTHRRERRGWCGRAQHRAGAAERTWRARQGEGRAPATVADQVIGLAGQDPPRLGRPVTASV